MSTKRAILPYSSNSNQLPYDGTAAQYYPWESALSVGTDEKYDSDGVPVRSSKFSLSWPPLDKKYSPVYVRYRVRNDQLSTQSNWSVPTTLYLPVVYAVYKRRVATEPQKWVLVETTRNLSVGPYQENWAGRVQYAVGIYHVAGVPSESEGVASATSFTNRYILFATDPTNTIMNTNPYIT